MRHFRVTALSATIVLTALAGGATMARGETLEEAMVLAYQHNPTLLARRAALRATDEGVPEALSGWRPTVTLNGSRGVSRNKTESSFFTSSQNRNPLSASATLTQPLFSGGRTVAARRRADNEVLAERAALADVEQQVLLDAATAYMNVVRDQAVLDLATNNEQRLQRQLSAAKDRFEVGEVTRTDVAQAESRLSNAVAERVRAQGDLVSSRAAYLKVVGSSPEELKPAPPVAELPASEEEGRSIASDEAPSVIRAIYVERAAHNQVDQIFGEFLPSLDLTGDLSYGEDTSQRDSKAKSAALTARLTVPLYQAGSVSARVRQAKQVASQRRLEIDDARRVALQNVTQWWQSLETARAQIAAFTDAVRAAQIALDGVEEEAKVGSRTTLDVLDAEQELFDAQTNLVRAQRDEVVASYGLRSAIGRLTAKALGLPVDIYDERAHYDAVRNKFWGISE